MRLLRLGPAGRGRPAVIGEDGQVFDLSGVTRDIDGTFPAWDLGKQGEIFNQLGPYLVAAKAVADPGNLGLRPSVNGRPRPNGSTQNLIFGVPCLLWYLKSAHGARTRRHHQQRHCGGCRTWPAGKSLPAPQRRHRGLDRRTRRPATDGGAR